MTPPLVSIVVPFLDCARFLAEAVESVRAQTYDRWELILVDDGSTDGSTEIARAYAASDARIRALEHPGRDTRGTSASRNLGGGAASGELVAYLDGDDVWLPHKLERQVELLALHPEAELLYGNTLYWYGWTGDAEDTWLDHLPDLGIPTNTVIRPPALLEHFLTWGAAVPCTCSVVVRRAALEGVGGWEERFGGLYDDQAFYAKLCLRDAAFVSDEVWDKYRRHADSMCQTAEAAGVCYAERVHYLDWLEGYLHREGFGGSPIWRKVRREIRNHRRPGLERAKERVARAIPESARRWLARRLVRP